MSGSTSTRFVLVRRRLLARRRVAQCRDARCRRAGRRRRTRPTRRASQNLHERGVDFVECAHEGRAHAPSGSWAANLGPLRLVILDRRAGGVMPVMDCELGRALLDAAAVFVNEGVRDLFFSGIYEYRPRRHSKKLSEHAHGLAIDVHQFGTADGRIFDVAARLRAGRRRLGRARSGRLRRLARAPRGPHPARARLRAAREQRLPRDHHGRRQLRPRQPLPHRVVPRSTLARQSDPVAPRADD